MNFVKIYKSFFYTTILLLLSFNVLKADEASTSNITPTLTLAPTSTPNATTIDSKSSVLKEVVISNEYNNHQKKHSEIDYKCVNKYKLAIFAPGYFDEFNDVLYGVFSELSEHNFVRFITNDEEKVDFFSDNYYKTLTSKNMHSCISLVKNGFYNAEFDNEKRAKIKEEILTRVKNKEITMLLGLGSMAGLDYANLGLDIPVIIADASNPDKIGIMDPTEYSTKPKVFVQWFHNYVSDTMGKYSSLFNFKSLGVLLDRSEQVQKIQSYETILGLSKELGYTVKPCFGRLIDGTDKEKEEDISKCIEQFLDVDAVFLPIYNGLTKENANRMMEPLLEKGVKVFSEDMDLVENGVLISIFHSNIYNVGLFVGRVMSRMADGEKIENISQIYIPYYTIALNLKTAKIVKWTPSFELLMQVEYLYDK